jgi:putative inorganic carbon (HCO3(-)) transporter
MVRALVMLLLGTNALVAVARPWVGVVLAYLIAILTPQTIWWWAFDGIRPSLFVVAPTLLGFAVALVAGRLDYSRVRTRLNACMLILWISFTVAYLFGPYVNVMSDWRFYDPAAQFSMLTKAFVTYFVAVILLDNTDKLKYAAMVIVITAIYMTYWANAQYFVYNHFGRLNGPTSLFGESIYFDENVFAVLFVVGMPFLYYFGRYLQNRILRWAVWLVIPLSWHAVFLTASRGALLAIGAVLMVFVMRLEKKIYGVLIVIGFMVAFAWQAGDVMKSRSATITTFEQEHSATSRLDAWDAAVKMMATHPITGVGFASFGQAYQYFSPTRPRVAHNTFFQVGAEWGVIAGFTYLFLMFSTLNRLRKMGKRLREVDTDEGRLHYYLNDASMLALVGIFVCSMFLSLDRFELFYFLLLLANGALVGGEKLLGGSTAAAPAAKGKGPRRIGRPAPGLAPAPANALLPGKHALPNTPRPHP